MCFNKFDKHCNDEYSLNLYKKCKHPLEHTLTLITVTRNLFIL